MASSSATPSQEWVDGYQAAIEAVCPLIPNSMGAILWSKDPAIHAAAVARFEERRDAINQRLL